MITCNWIWLQLIYFLITAKTEWIFYSSKYRNTPGGDHLINHTSLFCITFQKGWTAGMRIWIILLDPDHFAASRSFCRTRKMQYISSHSDSNLTHFKYRYITDFSETDLDSTTMLGWTSSGLNDRGKLNNTYEVGPGPWRCPLQARVGYLPYIGIFVVVEKSGSASKSLRSATVGPRTVASTANIQTRGLPSHTKKYVETKTLK